VVAPPIRDERALARARPPHCFALRPVLLSLPAAFLLMLAFSFPARSDELPRATPAEEGFSPARLDYIDQFYAEKVRRGEVAGIVTLISRHGKVVHESALGYADLGKKITMQRDTVFRLYSMTKPITATALMMLYEEGKFQLDDPISKYLPEFKGIRVLRTPDSARTDTVPAVREPTIHDLFRHTAGLKHGGDAYEKANLFGLDVSLGEMITRLAKIPLYHQPGTLFEYSIGPDVQARLVEIFSGMPFDQFLQQRLFGPLDMKDSGYWVKDSSRLAAVHWLKDGTLVPCDDRHGCVETDSAPHEAKNMNSYTAEHAHKGGSYGLVGTAEDYWRFAQMLLNGGQMEGRRFLSPHTVHYMATDHLSPLAILSQNGEDSGTAWGLGFALLKSPAVAGVIGYEGSYFWAGAANTTFWIDPKEDIVVVLMTQSWNVPNAAWATLRAQMSAMVYAALVE
jgi:CubicO group peptidase (beta-lactamase class C family)